MSDEPEEFDPYADDDPESFDQWFPLEHEHLVDAPFKFYFIKLKSNSTAAVELVMDPNSTLRGVTGGLPPLEGVDESTRVTTTIIGHERTLRFRAIFAIASVDRQDNSVAIMSNKEVAASG